MAGSILGARQPLGWFILFIVTFALCFVFTMLINHYQYNNKFFIDKDKDENVPIRKSAEESIFTVSISTITFVVFYTILNMSGHLYKSTDANQPSNPKDNDDNNGV